MNAICGLKKMQKVANKDASVLVTWAQNEKQIITLY